MPARVPQQETRLEDGPVEEGPAFPVGQIPSWTMASLSMQPEAGQLSGLTGWGTAPYLYACNHPSSRWANEALPG